MKRTEIIIGGYGGQGILLAGYIIGNAAIKVGYNATYLPSYGPEARGGKCASRIIIDKDTIDYPLVREPDILIIMYQEAYNAYIDMLKKGGKLLVDSGLVKLDSRAEKAEVYKIPATKIAEELGRRIVANIVMIGAFTSITRLVPEDIMKQSVIEGVRGRYLDLNLGAFNRGLELGRKLVGDSNG